MRERLQGRGRILIMSGGALLITVVLGVLWGFADTTGLADVDGDTSTTTTAALATGDTTTTTTPDGETDVVEAGDSTTSTVDLSPATTASTGGSGNGSGGASDTTIPPPNQPPVIEDAGLSSIGKTLTISPVVSDPEDDDLTISVIVDGDEVSTIPVGGSHVETLGTFFMHDATIDLIVVDSSGNTTSETFTHHMEAITTVTVRDLTFTVGSAACFAEDAAQRISATVILGGAVVEGVNVSEELRQDRSMVTLFDQASSEIVGEPPSQVIKVFAALDGRFDTHQQTHTESDEVLVTMFSTNSCEGFLTYEIEMITR
jgi:hypothetical protein